MCNAKIESRALLILHCIESLSVDEAVAVLEMAKKQVTGARVPGLSECLDMMGFVPPVKDHSPVTIGEVS